MVHFLAGQLGKALGHIHETGHHQELAVHHLLRQFEIPFIVDVAHGEHTLLHRTALLQQLFVLVFLRGIGTRATLTTRCSVVVTHTGAAHPTGRVGRRILVFLYCVVGLNDIPSSVAH